MTHIHNAAHDVVLSSAIGSTVHDSATVTGVAAGGTPTGDVTFTVYLGTKDCNVENADSTDQATVALDNGFPLIEAVMVQRRARTSREGYNASRSSQPA